MSLTKEKIETLGNELYDAWKDARQISALTDQVPDLSIEDAYQVQLQTVNRRVAGGEMITGKKIGITAKAVMNLLGVNQPDFGHLMSGMQYNQSDPIPHRSFCQPKGEGEIAFLLKRDLAGPGITGADVLAATECIIPSFEIVDSRITDWKIKIQDTVADNASAAAYVLGSPQKTLKGFDLATCGMVLKKNGEIIGTGAGAATLSHPLNAVSWLANKLGSLGITLKAGEVILSGSLSIMFPIDAGDHLEMEVGGLGRTECRFE